MSSIIENIINNKFYSAKDEVENKLNVFFDSNVISQEEYSKLM